MFTLKYGNITYKLFGDSLILIHLLIEQFFEVKDMWPKLTCHSHRIQTGRYDRNNTPREQRICLFCTAPDIEDEFHFIIKCPCYIDLRKKYIKKCYFTRVRIYEKITVPF